MSSFDGKTFARQIRIEDLTSFVQYEGYFQLTEEFNKKGNDQHQVLQEFCDFCTRHCNCPVLISHGCFSFDKTVLESEFRKFGMNPTFLFFDSLLYYRDNYPKLSSYTLSYLASNLSDQIISHRALDDALILFRLLSQESKLYGYIVPMGLTPLRSINGVGKSSESVLYKSNYRCIEDLKQNNHKMLAEFTKDLDDLSFNKGIARLYGFVGEVSKLNTEDLINTEILNETIRFLLVMLGPITPHLAEEGWRHTQGKKTLLCEEPWPKYDKNLIKESEILLPVQVNGKKRAEIKIAIGLRNEDVETLALELPEIKNIIQDSKIKKIIVVPGRIINIVF